MILKRVYEQYGLNIESILITNMKKLDLTTDELNILLVLFSMHKRRRTFSIGAISRRVDYSQNEIAEIIESLLNKNFVNIRLESNNEREREVYDLDGTFIKITEMLNEEENERKRNVFENQISETILNFEKNLGRMIKTRELSQIRKWYEDDNYTQDEINDAIKQAGKRISIPFVERILSQEIPKEVEIDEKTDEVLDKIFKKL